mmetsp:Transcript_21219/g.29429  ORF Transcript_21219/g.29429 Transcript_21219/m.29429 type:complete len:133 (+) Transcript_21219:69-467(+)|eukprot:CAMPEP_0196598132 /NCGR_PEP_ID=MMETSP1081-20130531/94142_1 /TAXON_ID=36882 /ORGANISM="Pyramimonas amylifera, Strain CCMP720" /LENGTH=132 /DNA_ID=CAMNT_0041923779 /DNA_START=669 /DNA_END=1067 /DNA_ORIENTATION=+
MATFQTQLKTDEDWAQEVGKPAGDDGEEPGESGVPGYLQVIDCHSEWCGSCKAIQSTFRKIFFDYGDRPLKFYTANIDKIGVLDKYRGSCQPVFLFYQDNQMLECITGVDAPKLVSLIMQMMPGGEEEEPAT